MSTQVVLCQKRRVLAVSVVVDLDFDLNGDGVRERGRPSPLTPTHSPAAYPSMHNLQ
ncbi:MAG: hypothetical protein QM778_31445 [Myxococcales bacterium]